MLLILSLSTALAYSHQPYTPWLKSLGDTPTCSGNQRNGPRLRPIEVALGVVVSQRLSRHNSCSREAEVTCVRLHFLALLHHPTPRCSLRAHPDGSLEVHICLIVACRRAVVSSATSMDAGMPNLSDRLLFISPSRILVGTITIAVVGDSLNAYATHCDVQHARVLRPRVCFSVGAP
jgi:hypothetical protein